MTALRRTRPPASLRHIRWAPLPPAAAACSSKFGLFLFPACARSGGKTLVRDARSAKSDAVPVYAKAALIVMPRGAIAASLARGAATGL